MIRFLCRIVRDRGRYGLRSLLPRNPDPAMSLLLASIVTKSVKMRSLFPTPLVDVVIGVVPLFASSQRIVTLTQHEVF